MSVEVEAGHPVTRFATLASAELDALTDTALWSLDPVELGGDLAALTVLENRIAELKLRLLAQAGRTGVGQGGDDPRAWWQVHTRTTRRATLRADHLAAALDNDDREATRTALAAGRLLVDQAEAILRALAELPAGLDPHIVTRAEAELVSLAAAHDADDLRHLGRRILDLVAPHVAEDHERRLLEADEAHAARTCTFTITDDGHGTCHGHFRIPTLHGEILRKALTALANPARHPRRHENDTEDDTESATVERVAAPLRYGTAFCEYLERYPADRLPHTGGVTATIVITTTLDQLRTGLGTTHLDTGPTLTPSETRRLACDAGIIPAVLGSSSHVLDLGRKRRLHTQPQRIALALRDHGCTAQHCDWPPGLCHTHHDQPWAHGGPTTLTNARLLCPHHHRQAHNPAYEIHTHPDNTLTFHRRT